MAVRGQMTHYIVMVQVTNDPKDRTYSEFDSLYACMEGITKIYDDYLKQAFPRHGDMVYNMDALVKFIHSLQDISCLVYNKKSNMYKPQGRPWILQELYKHLLKNKDE